MKKDDLLKALLVLLQFILLGVLFCIVFAFTMTMCSCSTPKTTIQDEWYFDYDEVVDIDMDRNIMWYYWDDPYEMSMEDIMIEDIVDSNFVITNNKLEYVRSER